MTYARVSGNSGKAASAGTNNQTGADSMGHLAISTTTTR